VFTERVTRSRSSYRCRYGYGTVMTTDRKNGHG